MSEHLNEDPYGEPLELVSSAGDCIDISPDSTFVFEFEEADIPSCIEILKEKDIYVETSRLFIPEPKLTSVLSALGFATVKQAIPVLEQVEDYTSPTNDSEEYQWDLLFKNTSVLGLNISNDEESEDEYEEEHEIILPENSPTISLDPGLDDLTYLNTELHTVPEDSDMDHVRVYLGDGSECFIFDQDIVDLVSRYGFDEVIHSFTKPEIIDEFVHYQSANMDNGLKRILDS